MIRPHKHARGFATVTALVSLGLVSVTVAGLMTRIGMEARRTERENERAQHDQIVIARSLGSVQLPPELKGNARCDVVPKLQAGL